VTGMIRANAERPPLRPGSVDIAVTSVSYWGLRRYGDDPAEHGQGSLAHYLCQMGRLSLAVHATLADHGVFWLNIGDTAAGSGGAGGDHNPGGMHDDKRKYRQGDAGLDRMQVCNIPTRVATMLQDLCTCGHDRQMHRVNGPARCVLCGDCNHFKAAWLCRSVITWDKATVRRGDRNEAHTRRPGVSSETILMLTKSRHHRWNPGALPELGNVWHFPPGQPLRNGHPAPFPDELPRRCILATTQPGDLVLDPCAGSGTTVRVAHALDRRGVGLDLYAGAWS
jgi:hypothetical protein